MSQLFSYQDNQFANNCVHLSIGCNDKVGRRRKDQEQSDRHETSAPSGRSRLVAILPTTTTSCPYSHSCAHLLYQSVHKQFPIIISSDIVSSMRSIAVCVRVVLSDDDVCFVRRRRAHGSIRYSLSCRSATCRCCIGFRFASNNCAHSCARLDTLSNGTIS